MKRQILVLLAMLPSISHATDPIESAKATNSLGITLLQKATPVGNTLLSPFSIEVALAMTYAGADGETARQMAGVLGYGPDAISQFAALSRTIGSQIDQENMTWSMANALFGQSGYPFLHDFLETLKSEFSAPLETVNFQENPAAATDLINAWIAARTKSKIENLIPSGALTRDTALVLANAIYFKSAWLEAFDKGATRPGPFRLEDGSTVEVPMMSQTSRLGYLKAKGYQAVTLPYANSDFLLAVLLPDESLPALEKSLTGADLQKVAAAPDQRVALQMPGFRIAPPVLQLGSVLARLGMPSAFDQPQGSANFSKMGPRKPDDYLYISNVFHKTFIDVDEAGTEAAAATAVVMMRMTAMPVDPPLPIIINRPFLFALMHRPTGTALFLGRVSDPRDGKKM
ncbi:MAG: serpin family protein [Terrimicrobiaceae bacterium]